MHLPAVIWSLATSLLIPQAAASSRHVVTGCREQTVTARASDQAACAWLDRAAASIGLSAVHGEALHIVESSARFLADQSDRPSEPFIMQPTIDSVWMDPITGVERVTVFSPYGGRRDTYLLSARATFHVTDSGPVADRRAHGQLWSLRAFDPWAILVEWLRATDVRVGARRPSGGHERTVLERTGPFGVERLLLDTKTAIPVALERIEPHYFLGPRRVEYRYATWSDGGAAMLFPVSVTRLVDGRLDESRFVVFPDSGALVRRERAPVLGVPDSNLSIPVEPQLRFGNDPVDTAVVGGETYLFVSHTFTSVVSLQRDTVFLLDAPAGEVRARQEHDWVGRLFPGHHPVVLVMLNHVWPHIAGARFWVAHGASVVAPRAIVPFLSSVLAQRWSAMPDDLDRERGHIRPHIRAVDDSALFAGGQIQLYAMEGINGEGVLLSYVRPARFVWASDHVQSVSAPNIYVEDVRQTVARHGLTPQWVSGPHFRRLPWALIDTLPHVLAHH